MSRHGAILGTVLISILIALVWEGQENGNDGTRPAAPYATQDFPLDTVSLMQGRRIQLEYGDVTPSTARTHNLSPLSFSESKGLLSRGRSAVDALHTVLIERSSALRVESFRLATSMGGAFLPILVLLLAVGLLTCMLLCILKRKDEMNLRCPTGDLPCADEHWPIPNELDVNRKTFHDPSAPAAYGSQQILTPHFTGSATPAGTWASLAPRALASSVAVPNTPPRSLPLVSGRNSAAQSERSNFLPLWLARGSSQENRILPPPLCPSLVLPVCEARFGVPINELSLLSSECDIGIVGMSQNTLLRAAVKKVGSFQRVLEIGMPEVNSAPRATVGPAASGAKSLEIRGLKAAYYGTLEMRTNGACYVVKDGATVLSIDGNANSLKLQICSGNGTELASVRCSSEPFGGVDHVEVRVEPGVDTILVLACVLAVLLLSPYPPE